MLVVGIVMMLYSPWVQDAARKELVKQFNSKPGMSLQLGSLDISFPLKLTVGDVAMAQDGDTLVAARKLSANVALLPLLRGEAKVRDLFLSGARYQMGNADSLMMMVITADTLQISPAVAKLSPMDINVENGRIAHGRVSMVSKPDTSSVPIDSAAATDMKIRIGRIGIDDLTFTMTMLPTIDSLGATVGHGSLRGGLIDMLSQKIELGSFTGTQLNAAYIAPDSATLAAYPAATESASTSKPWTIEIDSIGFSDSQGLYTTRGYAPEPGLDFGYIQAYDMDLSINHFYNQAETITLPLSLKATERCGLELEATGTFAMDSAGMHFDAFHVKAPGTDLSASGMMGIGSIADDPSLPLQLAAAGYVGIPALRTMFPAFTPYLAGMNSEIPLDLTIDLAGTAGDIDVKQADIRVNRMATIKAKGRLLDAFAPYGPNGRIDLSGRIIDVRGITASMLKGTGITIPPMTINGVASMNRGNMAANLKAVTLGGDIALNATYKSNIEGYDLHLTTRDFPVQAFMKDLGVGKVTADVKAQGHGFDLYSPKTEANATATITSAEYGGYDYRNITLAANIADGQAAVKATADNTALEAQIDASGNLAGNPLVWKLELSAPRIDLEEMKMSETPATISLALQANAQASADFRNIKATALLHDLSYTHETGLIDISNVKARFTTSDSLTTISLGNRDMLALASAPYGLDSLMVRADTLMAEINRELAAHSIEPDSLQKAMPQFNLYITAGSDNLVNDMLLDNRMTMNSFKLMASNDSVISLNGRLLGLRSATMTIDTINLNLDQVKNRLHIIAAMDNKPGTLDNFAHVQLDLLAFHNKMALRATQRNISDKTGFDFGAVASLADSTVTARVFPLSPTIGYKKWTVNVDNFISYDFPTRHINANLRMKGDNSSLSIYSQTPADSTDVNDLVLKISDINIADWVVINPFAPPIKGNLSADVNMRWDGSETIDGNGNIKLTDFVYGKETVGNFEANFGVNTNMSGSVRATADLIVDGEKTMTISGALNDSTALSPFDLDLDVIRFPLRVANPFLPQGMATLTGTLNGKMDVNGDANKPIINGEIYFDQAALRLGMTGTSFKFSDVKIPVVNNLVTFSQFGIFAANDNPLLIDGTADISDMSNVAVDLGINANNIMLINTSRAPAGAELYGKAFADLNASARGNMKFMRVNADLKLLSGTNITYELSDATDMLDPTSRTDDMVKFVNFTDSTAMRLADSIADSQMLMALDASLTIQNGTTITVDLSASTRDKVEISPEGQVFFTMSPISDGRLTGRININSGMARYTIPVIGAEKSFTIDAGSYIAFNGDMMNPVLNLHATDEIKTNVTQSGQNSRLVNFDVLLGVTGTLNQMDVKFDLTTNDDLTVANELQSMSAEQRANQAMNLLLYNMYTGPGTKASANLGANPLFSFLESQVNNWAANNIKGVDISFGIDQYDQTRNGSTQQTMNYSYQVSKSLFNDRFKIVVGGNYSTDQNSEENLSENLINDISFEYYLNKKRTMLVKLFRHTGYESILEGEITETGAGFVYKKKLSRLSDMLPKFMRPRRKPIPSTPPVKK